MNENPPNNQSAEQQDHLVDLMVQRATAGLSETEQQELDQLANFIDNKHEFERFEATAATFDLAISSVEFEAMPSSVHDRLLISAGKFLCGGSAPTATAELPFVEHNANDSKVELSKKNDSNTSVRWREMALIAVTAASLLLLLSGFNPFSKSENAPVASVFQRMDQLIASNPADLVDVKWQPVHAKSASGKVIWSDAKQEGYMVFSGVEMNDPSVEQYQLWIFDTDPGQSTPTDGGVFDISKSDIGPDGNVVIPIKASVPVDRAVQFAVTVEKPGGVYVSKREKIPVLAKIDGLK
jgi:hypothetical protein